MRNFLFTFLAIGLLCGAAEWCRELVGMFTLFSELSAPQPALRREAAIGGIRLAPTLMPQLPGRRMADAVADFAATPPSADFEERARAAADAYLNQRREEWKIRSYHELRPTVFVTPMGATVKYSVYQDSLPIVGMDLELSVDQRLQVSLGNSRYQPVARVDTRPDLSVDEAMEKVADQFLPDGESRAVTPVLYLSSGAQVPDLAYVVPVLERNRRRPANVTLRANDARVIHVEYSRTN